MQKDIILHIIKTYGIGLGNGYAFEFLEIQLEICQWKEE